MRNRWILGAAMIAASLTAHAQTYDLDITMTGLTGSPVNFSGSFTFDANGTGPCSAAFCAAGITPQFTSVLIRNPLSIDPPGGALAFTDTIGGSNTLAFFDTYGGTPGQSSYVHQLAFSLSTALGGPAADIRLSDIYLALDGNVSGTYSCGGSAQLPTPGVGCPTATLSAERVSRSEFGGGDEPHGVPEPGTFALLALALAGLVIARPAKAIMCILDLGDARARHPAARPLRALPLVRAQVPVLRLQLLHAAG
jgi:PEP-CTERM motif